MKRKLVKQGSSTLMVSLPSKWVKSNGLDKGSEVDIEEKVSEIIISANPKTEAKKEITIHISDDNKHDLKNILTHLYRRGFDRIILKGIDKAMQNTIRKTTSDILLGFEIVDMTAEFCVLENISEPSHEKYEVMIRRIFLIIKETQESQNLEDIEHMRESQDKHILFCRRIINKSMNSRSVLDWELLSALRHVEHKQYYMKKYLLENRMKPDTDVLKMMAKIKDMFELLYDSYFQKDIKKLHAITKIRNEYYFNKCKVSLEKSSGKKNVVYSYLTELFRLIAVASSPIMSMQLDESFKLDVT